MGAVSGNCTRRSIMSLPRRISSLQRQHTTMHPTAPHTQRERRVPQATRAGSHSCAEEPSHQLSALINHQLDKGERRSRDGWCL